MDLDWPSCKTSVNAGADRLSNGHRATCRAFKSDVAAIIKKNIGKLLQQLVAPG